jgi:hypothetical protein
MRKILLMSFAMAFTILLGVTLAYDGSDQFDAAEQARIEARLKAEMEQREAFKTLTLPYQVPGGMTLSQPGAPGGGYPSVLIDCPAGGYWEGEDTCHFNYDDYFNSGCNADTGTPPFSDISSGDIICGLSGVFEHINPDDPTDTVTYRDTDWYRINVTQPSELIVRGTADFPLQILVMDAGSEDCEDYEQLESGVAQPGDTVSFVTQIWPGVYWVWCGPDNWYADLWCDGLGPMPNQYVLWVEADPVPTPAVNTNIGDINTAVPFADLGQTTFGAGHNYDGPSCIGPYWNSAEDYVYKFTVSDPMVLDIILDPHASAWTSVTIDDFAPPDPDPLGCVGKSYLSLAQPHGFEQLMVFPGTYFVYVDGWSPPDSIPEYDLYIVEGVQTVGLGQTGNIPDCGVSNYGPLGETESQGNTYGWNGNEPANFAGTLVMGNSDTTMFSVYNEEVSNCHLYRGVTGLNMIDPYHPTSRYDDNDVLGGLTVEYGGFGYNTGGSADDIFVHGFKFTNTSGSTISDFYAGVYFDWDIDTDNGDTVFFDWTNNMIVQAPLDQSIFYGLCVANTEAVNLNSMTAVSQEDHIYPTGPDSGGWKMDVLYGLMSTPGDSIADSMYTDMSSLLSTGPYTIADGDSAVLLIAVIGGASLADVQNRAQIADTLTIPDFTVDPPPPPTGRCCYVSGADTLCADNLETECTGLGGYDWNRYLNCTDHPWVVSGCPYIVGDANGSNSYNGLDVTYGVNWFKYGVDPPLCPTCPIPDCNTWYYCGDVNASCSFNGLDVTYSVNWFKYGVDPAVPCVDCPPIE